MFELSNHPFLLVDLPVPFRMGWKSFVNFRNTLQLFRAYRSTAKFQSTMVFLGTSIVPFLPLLELVGFGFELKGLLELALV